MEGSPYLSAVLILGILVPVSTAIVCKANWREYGGSCYRHFLSINSGIMPNWEQALKACQDQKASLVSIHSEEEYTFVKNLTAHSMFFWIGLNDKATEGTHMWSDGTPVSFTSWSSNEPYNVSDSAKKNCVAVRSSAWTTQECIGGYQLPYVCKYSDSSGDPRGIESPYEGETRDALFKRIPNKVLVRHVILRKDGSTILSCAQLCLATEHCHSYNFKMADKQNLGECEINDATDEIFPKFLINRQNSVYAVCLLSST